MALIRDVALSMAPCGDGRFDLTYAHFYGSFLLGLCQDGVGPSTSPESALNPAMSVGSALPEHIATPLESIANPTVSLVSPLLQQPSSSTSTQIALPQLGNSVAEQQQQQQQQQQHPSDPINLFLGLDTGFDFALPWEGQQGIVGTEHEAVAVSPPLEWLFNDSVASGVGLSDGTVGQMWAYGLGWPNGGPSGQGM
jgi:hypothetical protein